MRTIASLSLLALLCACTGDLPAVDARAASDGRPDLDAQHAPDAGGGPDARAAVTIDVVCQPYVRTVVSANGARQVITYRYGVVDSVGLGNDFAVETCGPIIVPAPETCPAGSTCTGSSGPVGASCSQSYKTGSFVDGKLVVSCGFRIEQFAVDGSMTSLTDYSFTSIRVITY